MKFNVKETLIGKPLSSEKLGEEKYNIFRGLPILSSDAISSVAYAGEEILWVLVPVVGIMAYKYIFYAAIAIILLLLILVFSYRQTIDNYPNGGGAYIVARDNLGVIPGLVAGSSLLIDYTLTVAVSASAGTAAITSTLPGLLPHKVSITILLIVLMMVGNLRGIRESSIIFSYPTYIFIVISFIMIIYGIVKIRIFGYVPGPARGLPLVTSDITIFLFLRAFAAGCTALTGVEAVSNGIPNFREPAQKNAKVVLMLLGLIVILIFGGISYLATLYHAVPSLEKTVISQIASQVFGKSLMFYIMQVITAVILIMAANTSFSGFPLLLAVLSKDGFMPRQFVKRGDRLSYSNGIIALALAASILSIIFRGETHYLLPLYAVGVFISFTLSQSGMFLKWIRERKGGWIHKAAINGLGALVTCITAIIIGYTKFVAGAWVVTILIPLFVYTMIRIKKHYIITARQLSMEGKKLEEPNCERVKHFIILVEGVNKGTIKAINYAKCLSNDILAFHISFDDEDTERLSKRWAKYKIDIPLIVRKSPYRLIIEPIVDYINSEEYPARRGDIITIVMPQFVSRKWWANILHNQTALFIKNALMKYENVSIITVPYVIVDEEVDEIE